MTNTCGNETKIIGQTLFLGASVVNVNLNLGWGEQSSSATIELIEDFQPASCYINNSPINPFPIRNYIDNHYYTCCPQGYNCPDDCYIDERTDIYDSNRVDANGNPDPPKEKLVPGKIYYVWTSQGMVSRYWYAEDPGFFGTGTRVKPDGTLSDTKDNIYNLINVPVFFKFDNITYMGIIKSWETNFNNGRNFYRIEIESVSSLLRNSWMIVDGYAGSVFSFAPPDPTLSFNNQPLGSKYGKPRNYTGNGLNSDGTIRAGNIHNIFNVYGFLESLGPYGFGGANKNDKGISYNRIVKALKILTSVNDTRSLYWKSKNMFSPFGRILGKTMQRIDNDGYEFIQPSFSNYAFGVIPPQLDRNNIPRVSFTLDLSEVIIPPEDIRFNTSNKVIRISEFLQNLVGTNGQQTYWVSSHSLVSNNGLPYNIIKIKATDRTKYAAPNTIDNVINSLRNAGYNVTASNSGQSRNEEAKVRTMVIGGNQQRLYQAKNYRLGFNQANYIWSPVRRTFINYRRFEESENDKVKIPLGDSTRNPIISINILGSINRQLINADVAIIERLLGIKFNTIDEIWDDTLLSSNNVNCVKTWRSTDFEIDRNTGQPLSENTSIIVPGATYYSIYGNYEVYMGNVSSFRSIQNQKPTTSYTSATAPTPTPSPSVGARMQDYMSRYIPLFKDIISPFFGFKYEKKLAISPSNANIYKNIRPVWLDSWTGQLCIVFDIHELPAVSCGPMVSIYDINVLGRNSNDFGGSTDIGITTNPAGTVSSVGNPPTVSPTGGGTPPSSYFPDTDNSQYDGIGFVVTETEMRAAMAGTDAYLRYCMAKMPQTKPDLYNMLLNCWAGKGAITGQSAKTLAGNRGITIGPDTERGPSSLESSETHKVGTISIAGQDNQPGKPRGAHKSKITDINFNVIFHPGFIADLKIIQGFIKKLGDEYYGKQYLVKLPMLLNYRDQQYAKMSIPGFNLGRILVFSGSSKIFHNYNLTDKAWEEYGNYIDNELIIGGPHWRALSDNEGLTPPLLGYNASDVLDNLRRSWCLLSATNKAKIIADKRIEANEFINSPDFIEKYTASFDPLTSDPKTWTITVLVFNNEGLLVQTRIPPDATDDFLKNTLRINDQDFQTYKKLMSIRDSIISIYESMPSALECHAEQSITAEAREESYPCQDQGLREGTNLDTHFIDINAKYAEANVPCPTVSRDEENYTSPNETRTVYSYDRVTSAYVNDNAFLIPGINFDLGEAKEYTIVNTMPFVEAISSSGMCAGGKKLYIKSSLGNNGSIAFGSPANLTDPRAILISPRPIYLSKTSLAYREDPNTFLMPNVAAEDIAFYRYKYGGDIISDNEGNLKWDDTPLSAYEIEHLNYLATSFMTPLVVKNFLLPNVDLITNPGSSSNQSASFTKIHPKAAQAFFAAIPIKSNTYVYGPWINYPDLSKDRLFNYTNNPNSIIENLTDNTEVKYNADYVPWKYGGATFLDQAVIYTLQQNENYQTVQQKGSVKIYGPPVFNVGSYFTENSIDALRSNYSIVTESIWVNDYPEIINPITILYDDYEYIVPYVQDSDISIYGGYPIVQGVSINVGVDGTNTSYTLGTYNPKLGIYNKERTDELQTLSKRLLDFDAFVSNFNNYLQNQAFVDKFSMINDTSRFDKSTSLSDESAMFGSSPTEVLIGQSRYFLPDPGSGVPFPGSGSSDTIFKMRDCGRHESWAGLYMANEIGPELLYDYNNKAAMSLDGIFSPISFYPTKHNSTYPLSNFLTARYLAPQSISGELVCPICLNSHAIKDDYTNYSLPDRPSEETTYPCPACSKSRISIIKGSGTPQDSKTRVILDRKNAKPDINFYTLNPIVVSAGEFSNPNSPNNKPENSGYIIPDKHSIRVVNRGDTLLNPEINLDTTANLNYSNIIHPDYEGYDYELANIYGTGTFALNQRFFGFRGPMMLHGWGYDTDGYPVPNLNDEPLEIDNYGRYKRFQLDGNGFNDLSKPGLFVQSASASNALLGDIITKKYEWKNNRWKPKTLPSKYFSTNWASKAHTWPVGPIDLRWDHERRVWTGGAGCGEEKLPPFIITNSFDNTTLVEYLSSTTKSGCPYKMVYVTLEQDLTRPNNLYYYSNIIRGYIDDLEYKSEPLPNGYRRIVYLLDRSGYTAPAGTRLYCKYNSDLGYYEPISKPTIVTTGVIQGNQARIDLTFSRGRLSNTSPTTVVNFSNPLEFFVREGIRAIFSYIDGSWTLTAINN